MAESELERIGRKAGKKISFCKCNLCKEQCNTPCLGTPKDIEKIIDAGFKKEIYETDWYAGIIMGVIDKPVLMYQAELVEKTGKCVFFENGLCKLHDLGLKPTEGKLSHHSSRLETFKASRSLSWLISKEWLEKKNEEIINRIRKKLSQ